MISGLVVIVVVVIAFAFCIEITMGKGKGIVTFVILLFFAVAAFDITVIGWTILLAQIAELEKQRRDAEEEREKALLEQRRRREHEVFVKLFFIEGFG